MDWDFAVLEFADPPAYYPGDFTGWMGTQSPPQGQFIYSWMLGYPADKPPLPQQWAVRGNMYGGYTGDTWVHHYLDMYRGQSGACIYNDSWRCMSINIRELSNGAVNYARRWDSTTYNFASAYGRFP